MSDNIIEITIVNQAGSKTYKRGDIIAGMTIDLIKKIDLHFQGDPYSHYAGYSFDGQMLFSINALVPCVIEYDSDIPDFR